MQKVNTKGNFNESGILTVYNVYNYATLIHLAKLMILREPLNIPIIMKIESCSAAPKVQRLVI